MGIITQNSEYGVENNINFSFPLTCSKGEWKVVQGLKWDDFSKQMIATTQKELVEEREMALTYLKNLWRFE